MKFATALLAASLFALGLVACGGGGSGDSTSGSTAMTLPPAGSGKGQPGEPGAGGTTASQPSSGSKERSASADSQSPGAPATGAAGFRRSGADNSIPNFGSEASPGERAAAMAALSGYLAARSAGQWSRSCSYLGAAIRRQVAAFVKASQDKAPNCVALLKMIAEQAPGERSSPVRGGLAALRIEGDKGFALFYGPHHQQYMMPMVNEGGEWKVNQVDPVAYPPGSAPRE